MSDIEIISKLVPKNNAFVGLIDLLQVVPFNVVYRGGGSWTCVPGSTDYDVTWDADIEICNPCTGEILTVSAATLTEVPTGDYLYVTPTAWPTSSETISMEHGASIPNGSITVAIIMSGKVYTAPMWPEDGAAGGGDSAASGGTCTGSISLGVADGTFDYFHVKANSACRSAVIQWYADAAMTDRIYNTAQRDPYTGNGHEDWTPGSLTRATPLVGGLIYYKITNYSAVASTFTIHIRGTGR
jgi:hypothetical protein